MSWSTDASPLVAMSDSACKDCWLAQENVRHSLTYGSPTLAFLQFYDSTQVLMFTSRRRPVNFRACISPVMDDFMSNQSNNRIVWRACCALALICALIVTVGCQPQGRTGGLFGFNDRPIGNSAGSSSPFSINPFGNSGGGAGGFNGGGFAGGNGFPGGNGFQGGNPNQVAGAGFPNGGGFNPEFNRLNQQLGAFDADNELLNTEVASLRQKLELSNQYNQTLKQQLSDVSGQINLNGNQARISQQQFASLQQEIQRLNQRIATQDQQIDGQNRQLAAASRNQFSDGNSGRSGQSGFQNAGFSRGTATIRANNGLMQRLSNIQIPGGDARMDGDVIRVEFPTDRLFTSGSYRIKPAQLPVLQNVAAAIRESFPRQIIGIEAHWDGTPLNPPGTTDHQLTATQSLAVFEELVRLGIPARQMFTMAMASNRPRHRQQLVGGISPNRRIELVIYPETWNGQ